MLKMILSMALSAQLIFSSPALPVHSEPAAAAPLWWGMIDPELSLQFARLPWQEDEQTDSVCWDWSWSGFLAAIFGNAPAKEVQNDGTSC